MRPVPLIHQELDRSCAERLVHRGLDLFLGDVQRADRVPLGGMSLEIGLRSFSARLLHGGGSRPVTGQSEIGRIEACHDGASERRFGAAVGEAEEDPGALAEAADETGLHHQLQMPADAGLALAEHLGQVLDVEPPFASSARMRRRGLAGGAQRREGLGTGEARRGVLGSVIT